MTLEERCLTAFAEIDELANQLVNRHYRSASPTDAGSCNVPLPSLSAGYDIFGVAGGVLAGLGARCLALSEVGGADRDRDD